MNWKAFARPVFRALASISLLCLPNATAAAQDAQTIAFWNRQMAGLQRALSDPSANARAQAIWFQLVRYSGVMFPVLPAQTFQMGRALPSGIVLLDVSTLGEEPDITAFWMAHEYAHQVQGHTSLYASRLGNLIIALSGTAQEDDADRWAGRFLRVAGYDADIVATYLCDLPGGGPGDTHSSGPARARTVALAAGATRESCTAGLTPSAEPDSVPGTGHGRREENESRRELEDLVGEALGYGDGATLSGHPHESIVLQALQGVRGRYRDADGYDYRLQRRGRSVEISFDGPGENSRGRMPFTWAHPDDPALAFAIPSGGAAWKRTSDSTSTETRWTAAVPMTVTVYEVNDEPSGRERCSADVSVRGAVSVSVSGGVATFVSILTNPIPSGVSYDYRTRDCETRLRAGNPPSLDLLFELGRSPR